MSESPKTLALDLGSSTGWAMDANGVITSGFQRFTQYKGCQSRAADHEGIVFNLFHAWLTNQICILKPNAICYENVYRWMSSDAAKCYGAFRGIVMVIACKYDIPLTSYSPTEIKKHWTGKGNANKRAMLIAGQLKVSEQLLVNGDECDARAILSLHLSK